MSSSYRLFAVIVSGVRRLSPTFLRITLTGPELAEFVDNGADQRIKVLIPLPGCGLDHLPFGADDWFGAWQALPDTHRNPMRTYTVREVRFGTGDPEVDVDFALHPGAAVVGPATGWATAARVGEQVVIVGPRRPSQAGRAWRPALPPSRVLLAADETAVPAISRILEELPEDVVGDALLEVPSAEDELLLPAPVGVRVSWLARGPRAHGSLLVDAVLDAAADLAGVQQPGTAPAPALSDSEDETLWDVAEETAADPVQIWVAAEHAVALRLRRSLASGRPRGSYAFMGYWRHGHAES